MRIPSATYRLQLGPGFGFPEVAALLEYLEALGITDLYFSPVFRARPGSAHGYDVLDPTRLNPEFGSPEEFRTLAEEVRLRGLGWLQDIVPNHMAYDGRNPYLADILENGEQSAHRNLFDVDWNPPFESLRGRVLAPLLGSFYGEALERGEIRIVYSEEGFRVTYFDQAFPLGIDSYPDLLAPGVPGLRRALGEDDPDFVRYLGVLYTLRTLASTQELEERGAQVRFIKRLLRELYRGNPEVRRAVDAALAARNGRPGEPESFQGLDRLLSGQGFRLCFWKVATEELNYRRFFSINELISVRVEREEVFRETHALVLDLVRQGIATGLRVDHVDGLYDPGAYLERLRSEAPEAYVVVEKILEPGEELPAAWPVQGTTGYDFLNCVNGIFVDPRSRRAFDRLYASLRGVRESLSNLVYEKKKLLLYHHMAGDLDNLARLLKEISASYRHAIDITLYGLKRALAEVMAAFPVYRTYGGSSWSREADSAYLREAVKRARERCPDLVNELGFLEGFLLLEFPAWLPEPDRERWTHFLKRFQQYTGPLTAKGFEDTVLYVFNRLLALNEVGSSPERFGTPVEEFHTFNRRRLETWPHALSATATHDTKRGEDVRARLAVLSELPEEWSRAVGSWRRLNARLRRGRKGRKLPDRNDEYALYQTLVGAWPFCPEEVPAFRERLRNYLVKAVREAKVHTGWLKPNAEYEEAYVAFAEGALDPGGDFLPEFLPFQRRVAHHGVINSLSQVLLKTACPGVPDFYQGTELWDLSLVDPDNRRPVDYELRRRLLADIRNRFEASPPLLLAHLLTHPEDGGVKLFLAWRGLGVRQEHPALFQEGDYLPLDVEGPYAEHAVAFARRLRGRWALAVAPRLTVGLVGEGAWPLGEAVWGDTRLRLPAGAPATWSDAFTNLPVSGAEELPVGTILQNFPVALLLGAEG
ncbi:MAG: malto-oligosyltrehalose synthase [Thermodesulfobacteriota bacterium]